MHTELDALAQRIQQLADMTRQLRLENQQLRQQAAEQASEIKRLNGLLAEAGRRIEAVMARLPGEDDNGAH
jgi:cell division protein ZapB